MSDKTIIDEAEKIRLASIASQKKYYDKYKDSEAFKKAKKARNQRYYLKRKGNIDERFTQLEDLAKLLGYKVTKIKQ